MSLSNEDVPRLLFLSTQVVLLGCGLDTRAFRMEWPESTKIWEVDDAAVLNHKRTVLSRFSPLAKACTHV